jgi:ribosomal protein S18 acetylase RimI-like enzyme
MTCHIEIRTMCSEHLGDILCLFRAIEAEEAPSDLQAALRGETGLRLSLSAHDFTQSDSCWPLLAWVDKHLAGYALAVRVPKLDARKGFLLVDELYVLRSFRNRGVATKLLEAVHLQAQKEGYCGVRLLVRPSNEAARRLYARLGYAEHASILCEHLLAFSEPQSGPESS